MGCDFAIRDVIAEHDVDGDGSLVRVPKRTILARRPSALSAMPEGLERLMTPEEFADLIVYLESLKESKPVK